MARSKEDLIELMYDCVVEMEDEDVVDICNEYLEAGYDAYDGIMDGLVAGMNKASELYDEEEYFVTDVLLCSDALYAGLEVLRPHLKSTDAQGEQKKVVIGVVEGDTPKEVDADIIAMSTLMTTTMGGMGTVIKKLEEAGIRDKVKVMIGGGPISRKFADEIGAEGYSRNAVEAVKLAKQLTGIA